MTAQDRYATHSQARTDAMANMTRAFMNKNRRVPRIATAQLLKVERGQTVPAWVLVAFDFDGV